MGLELERAQPALEPQDEAASRGVCVMQQGGSESPRLQGLCRSSISQLSLLPAS